MPGTRAGGLKAAATNKAKYGSGFYSRIGMKGGRNGHTGGFASMSYEKVSAAGRKGGHRSTRGTGIAESIRDKIYEDYNGGVLPMKEIATKYNVSVGTVSRIVKEKAPF